MCWICRDLLSCSDEIYTKFTPIQSAQSEWNWPTPVFRQVSASSITLRMNEFICTVFVFILVLQTTHHRFYALRTPVVRSDRRGEYWCVHNLGSGLAYHDCAYGSWPQAATACLYAASGSPKSKSLLQKRIMALVCPYVSPYTNVPVGVMRPLACLSRCSRMPSWKLIEPSSHSPLFCRPIATKNRPWA